MGGARSATGPSTAVENCKDGRCVRPSCYVAFRSILRDFMTDPPSTRVEELRSFLFFTVVMAPVLAVVLVGGYGFVVWMYYLVSGPPQA